MFPVYMSPLMIFDNFFTFIVCKTSIDHRNRKIESNLTLRFQIFKVER